jgi:hypothetical protein
MESYRLLVVRSLQRFGQVPFWDPHACGGFPFWASPEAATIVVSPLLALYLLLPLAGAIRIEVAMMLALGLWGTWRLAARFVREPLVRAAVCIVGFMSSRWALQVAAGHTWHLAYAWLPWTLLAFLEVDEARGAARVAWCFATAALLAANVYHGGIYPFPHTALILGLYATYETLRMRSWRPLATATLCITGGIALAAPKLLPMADTMLRFPRQVPSREYLWPHEYLRMLVAGRSGSGFEPVPGLDWGFHEYGIYVGWAGLLALVAGNLRRPQQVQLAGLRFAGLALVWLSLGLFGPWPLLHLVPPFRSQHVPTRFEYPGILLLAVVAGGWADGHLQRWRARTTRGPRLDLAALAAAVLIIAPVAQEFRSDLAAGFQVRLPPVAVRATYDQTDAVPADLSYPESNGTSGLLVHAAAVGAIQCNSFHGFNHDRRSREGNRRPPELGARGRGDPLYRGEVYIEGEQGRAAIESFSPNEIVVRTEGAAAGQWLALNQNWDPSWTANGVPTVSHDHVNTYRLTQADERVVFAYRPRTLSLGMGAAAAGLGTFAMAALLSARLASRKVHAKKSTIAA